MVHGYMRVYERNIRPTLGRMPVVKVTTKTLTDLYGAHQARGLAPCSVYQIHACLSSMFDVDPASWTRGFANQVSLVCRQRSRYSAGVRWSRPAWWRCRL
jgi:hypothetical protein